MGPKCNAKKNRFRIPEKEDCVSHSPAQVRTEVDAESTRLQVLWVVSVCNCEPRCPCRNYLSEGCKKTKFRCLKLCQKLSDSWTSYHLKPEMSPGTHHVFIGNEHKYICPWEFPCLVVRDKEIFRGQITWQRELWQHYWKLQAQQIRFAHQCMSAHKFTVAITCHLWQGQSEVMLP